MADDATVVITRTSVQQGNHRLRIVYFGNNRVGLEVLRWLKRQPDELVGLVVHPDDTARYRDSILAEAGLPQERVLMAPDLRTSEGVHLLSSLGADIGLSVFFAYILKPHVINVFPRGVVNLHPGYLPFNRGRHTNVWSIVDGTPAGATIHYVDEGVDTGDIIEQVRVPVTAYDTGASLYKKLEDACIELFVETWPKIASGTAPRQPQHEEDATVHRAADLPRLDEIDLDQTYTARHLIDVLRARTFSPYPGAYFKQGDERVYMRLQLLKESELNDKEQSPNDE